MNRPYTLSEEEFHKLQRAQDSLELMSILFSEVHRPTTYTPQMISSFLECLCEDISVVIQSAVGKFSPEIFESQEKSNAK